MNPPFVKMTSLVGRGAHQTREVLDHLADDIVSALREPPYYVILRGAPPAQDRRLATFLARLIAHRPPYSRGSRPEDRNRVSFTRVQVDPEKAARKTGSTSYSRTNQPLDLHTDSTYLRYPHELVSFQMIRADVAGGVTLMMPVEGIIENLDKSVLAGLSRPVFPFGKGPLPILWSDFGSPRIRYYRSQIDISGGLELSKSDRALIGSLDEVLRRETLQDRFSIDPGEILFLNNTRVLHGRTGFGVNSSRLMYRFRAFAGCLN